MPAADRTITIDGTIYATNFQGFDTTMNARTAAGEQVEFRPWPLQAHLSALDNCVLPSAQGLVLDSLEFGRRVLTHSGVAEDAQAAFAPLALWWASGGEASPAALGGGWYECSTVVRVQLRPWTSGERFLALSRCASGEEGGARFDLGAYLRALLNASVVAVDPPLSLGELDSGATHALLEAVVALNAATPAASDDAFPDTPEAARITLRLCRALGWTPTQVWATPAAEVDRLLSLLDRIEASESGVPPRPSRAPSLADHADAVVIRIEDD